MARKLMSERTEADKGKCYCCYCGQHITDARIRTTEHLVPVSKGGSNIHLNKKPCCDQCNSERGNKSYDVWLKQLKEKNDRLNTTGPSGKFERHRVSIMIQNIKYWQFYVETSKDRLIRKKITNT